MEYHFIRYFFDTVSLLLQKLLCANQPQRFPALKVSSVGTMVEGLKIRLPELEGTWQSGSYWLPDVLL